MDARMEPYWLATSATTDYPSLPGGTNADVAILGGGMVGLCAAWLLKRAGRRVAIIESHRVAAGVSGRTTAKLTSQHNLIYADLIERHGEERARLYAQANQAGLEAIASVIAELGIDCDFEPKAAYTYSTQQEGLDALRAEVQAAQRLGLPASYVEQTSLPFDVAGAVRFEHQAQFHPHKFLRALAAAVHGDGSAIYENTRALNVEQGTPSRVITDKGTVRARDVIVATHLPFLNRGLFFAKAFPYRHAMLAARIAPDQLFDGMFISTDSPSLSLRTHHHEGITRLIAVGSTFKTGHGDSAEKIDELERMVRERFQVEAIDYWWANQDYYSSDRVPFVGKITSDARRVYVATGFGAWGLTNGMAAATLLCDRVMERSNPWSALYDATRLDFKVGGKTMLSENLHVATGWLRDRIGPRGLLDACDIPRGEGGLCRHDGDMAAVYKDDAGHVHTLSPYCTHMGCLLSWNRGEKSWDCPCHGSRFSCIGQVIEGPAIKDLDVLE